MSTPYRARLYDADRRDRDVTLTRQLVRSLDDRKILWVYLPARDREMVGELSSLLDLPKSIVESLAEEHGRARLVRDRSVIHLTVQAIERDQRNFVRREVDLVAGPNFVVSVHEGPVDALERFAGDLPSDTLLGRLDAGSFLAALVDSVIATWFDRIEEVERDIEGLDELALRGPTSNGFLVDVHRLRRRIAFVRRTIVPHREAFAPLVRPDFELDERLGRPWPGLVDRLERVIDTAENARDLLVGSLDIYLGRAAQRTNEVMKALTIVSSVLLPSIVLAGIMGMNFKLPFFNEPSNVWLVLGAMVVLAAGILVAARLRRWI
ncbi:MAG TPA: magnesium transporter CorA family protein [Candidatus Limnocylindrales bacterium]|jgi:magnesium transporter|nr:magnesium transporter CorA family protein [Candidatus Limnocylindrales bacterium]